jgi:hypothetical protein
VVTRWTLLSPRNCASIEILTFNDRQFQLGINLDPHVPFEEVDITGYFSQDDKEFELLMYYPVVRLYNRGNIHALSHFPKFNGEVLDLSGFSFSGWNQTTFSNLKILQLHNCTDLKELPNMSRVKSLKLLQCAPFTTIPPLPSLEELEMDRCAAVSHISLFPGLKNVGIHCCSNLVDILCTAKLHSFHMCYCSRITIDNISSLLQTPILHLTSLYLRH